MKKLNIELEHSEALVLFEFLSNIGTLVKEYNHPSEEQVLNNILADLESELSEPFSDKYYEYLEIARNTIAKR